MNMNCPRCGQTLEKIFYEGKIAYACPRGHGQAVSLSAVRGLCGRPEFVNMLWMKASGTPVGSGGQCPICGRPMSLITLPAGEKELELDICCQCQELWFDPSELESMPKPPPPPSQPELPDKAREILASHAIENLEENKPDAGPNSTWGYLAGLFGFPTEQNAPPCSSFPWCTWLIAALCTLLFILTFDDLETHIMNWGFIPAQWYRKGSLTILSSMFLHGGMWHLIGNLYFLLIFGDNVEDALGKFKYLGIILLSGLSANLLHYALSPESQTPCIGASGFISGIIAAYAVFFPKVHICLLLRWCLFFRWIRIPAWGAFTLWILYQAAMALMTFSLEGGIAFGAHLGGALFGLLAGFFMRLQVQSRIEQTMDT